MWGFLPAVGMTGQCFIKEGERGAGGFAARPSLPISTRSPGHSEGVKRLRNPLNPGIK